MKGGSAGIPMGQEWAVLVPEILAGSGLGQSRGADPRQGVRDHQPRDHPRSSTSEIINEIINVGRAASLGRPGPLFLWEMRVQ